MKTDESKYLYVGNTSDIESAISKIKELNYNSSVHVAGWSGSVYILRNQITTNKKSPFELT